MNSIPIDLATVDWFYVVILAVFVFFATLIGSLLAFSHRGLRRPAVGDPVHGGFRVLDLLSAPFAAADHADDAEGRPGRRAARSRRPGTAAQPGHRHHPANDPGALAHDPEKACHRHDRGWQPVFGKDHAPAKC